MSWWRDFRARVGRSLLEPTRQRRIPAKGSRRLADDESYRLYPGFGEDQHPSQILQTRSLPTEQMGDLYDRMLRQDPELYGLWLKRLKAVLGLPRVIVPADESQKAKEAAEFCRAAISHVPSFHLNLGHQMEGILKGVAFDELIWEQMPRGPLAGKIIPVDIIDRPMKRFKFVNRELFIRRSMGEDIRAPWGKFLCMRHGSKDSPWGSALLDRLYWSFFVKTHAWQYFGVAIEKWAQPTLKGTYERGASDDDIAEMQLAMEAIQTEYAVSIPKGIEIELVEATRSGQVSYEAFIGLLNRAQAVVMLGEIDTSGLGKGAGSYAKSVVSDGVRTEGVRCDCRELTSHLTDSLLAPLTLINLGPGYPTPKFVIEAVESEDRGLRQKGAARLLESGQPVPKRFYYMLHQVPEPCPGESTVIRRQENEVAA